ncbi:Pentatricopeptide repeat-containing protein [Apostasia shenzhenica]|uniref:Pentatricopeptide repeat-containing protein n=1 Tax=Apostasia shenzhenica TaxID=1088818 RepID=A0A2I0A7S5_9ASPA|nr:Pentatricopeptide repeat-containing protein [Apostasia shenzhenica]
MAFALLSEMDSLDINVGTEIFAELLQGCVDIRSLSEGRQIHARLLKSGPFFHKNEYLETKLLVFYAQCDCLVSARELFLRQDRPNVFSWAAMIGLLSRQGFSEEALLYLCKMLENGNFPDNFAIPNALKACSDLGFIDFAKSIHGYAIKLGFSECVYVLSSLVDFYGKCGFLEDAMKVFDEMPERNVITWNSLMVGFIQNSMDEEAAKIFGNLRNDGIQPTRANIASFLSASSNLRALAEGKQGHALAVMLGLELDGILGTSIVNFYCKLGLIEDAELIFYRMMDKDEVTWNVMISGYVDDGQIDRALDTCHQMRRNNLRFDCVTLSLIISACSFSGKLALARACHGYCIRNSIVTDLVVASKIINMYASFDRITCAEKVFNVVKMRDLVMWNAMISAYAQQGLSAKAFQLFHHMQIESVRPNVYSWNSVILGFLQNGNVGKAQDMFLEMKDNGINPDIVTWTTLICGLAQNRYGHDAIRLFNLMHSIGIRPNLVSIIGVLLACGNAASLRYGMIIHGYVIRRGFLPSLSITTSLISTYGKCGSIVTARKIFERVSYKTLPLFNAMITGYSLHGHAKEVFELFRHMKDEEVVPDDITFTGLLSACCNAGLMVEGLQIFTEMVLTYSNSPQKEHFGCMVRLLARFGDFEAAVRLLSEMPLKADGHILGSLLAACKEFGETELAEDLSKYLFQLEPTNSANFLTLANTYATSGRWKEASKIRAFMLENGLKQNLGCSWIEIETEIHVFVADDRKHTEADRIWDALFCLHEDMKLMGCWSIIDSAELDVRHEIICL